MANLLHPLFFVLAYATDKQLAKYLEYLKVENRILRNKLPKRILGVGILHLGQFAGQRRLRTWHNSWDRTRSAQQARIPDESRSA
jgi:hypothetical protein